MHITVEKYHKFPDGKVKGIAEITILIDNFPFTIRDVKVIENSKGGIFYALPTKEYLSAEGEKKYSPICAFFTKEGYHQFHSAITGAFKIFLQKDISRAPTDINSPTVFAAHHGQPLAGTPFQAPPQPAPFVEDPNLPF